MLGMLRPSVKLLARSETGENNGALYPMGSLHTQVTRENKKNQLLCERVGSFINKLKTDSKPYLCKFRAAMKLKPLSVRARAVVLQAATLSKKLICIASQSPLAITSSLSRK